MRNHRPRHLLRVDALCVLGLPLLAVAADSPRTAPKAAVKKMLRPTLEFRVQQLLLGNDDVPIDTKLGQNKWSDFRDLDGDGQPEYVVNSGWKDVVVAGKSGTHILWNDGK